MPAGRASVQDFTAASPRSAANTKMVRMPSAIEGQESLQPVFKRVDDRGPHAVRVRRGIVPQAIEGEFHLREDADGAKQQDHPAHQRTVGGPQFDVRQNAPHFVGKCRHGALGQQIEQLLLRILRAFGDAQRKAER